MKSPRQYVGLRKVSAQRQLSPKWLKSVELSAQQYCYFYDSGAVNNVTHGGATIVHYCFVSGITLQPDGTGVLKLHYNMGVPSDPYAHLDDAQAYTGDYGTYGGMYMMDTAYRWFSSYAEPKKELEQPYDDILKRDMELEKSPAITNFSGVWNLDSDASKAAKGGMAYSTLGLTSIKGTSVGLGVVNLNPGGFGIVGIYKNAKRTFVTALMPLPKTDAVCFEIDIDRQSGQTNLWIDDKGLDLGVLKGFENGAHNAALTMGAIRSGDHLLSGRFTNCAVAVDGQWQQARLSPLQKENAILPHHEARVLAQDSVLIRDLRTAVV